MSREVSFGDNFVYGPSLDAVVSVGRNTAFQQRFSFEWLAFGHKVAAQTHYKSQGYSQMTVRSLIGGLLVSGILFAVANAVCAQTVATADDAARMAAARTGGRVLDVQDKTINGDTVFIVRILLQDGRVQALRIPQKD